MNLQEGDRAPSFSLEDDQGQKVSLSSMKGSRVVLYFYPKDDTPGCTKEACEFQDGLRKFSSRNTKVIGISKDSKESHMKFKKKYGLNFPLLTDSENEVAKKYGAWGEKNMYGKKSMGLIRSTFVIDEKGKIEKIYRNVRVNGHVENVLESLNSKG